MDTTYTNNVAFIRKRRGLTQAQLASELGVTVTTISNLESGRCEPRLGLIWKLLDFFECTFEDLFY